MRVLWWIFIGRKKYVAFPYKERFKEQQVKIERLEYNLIKFVKERDKLVLENKILKKNMESLENNPEEYKRIKALDPYNEENWEG